MKQKSPPQKIKIKKPKKKNLFLVWYEIPVLNLDRAIHFYSSIFEIKFEIINTKTHSMAYFPAITGIAGALILGEGCYPGQTGTLLYLNVGHDLAGPLSKVLELGGQVQMGKTPIGEGMGFYSLVLDSEGNRLALCSNA